MTRRWARTCAGRTSWSGTSRSPRCRRRCGSEPPLRILGVVSSPRGLPALDVDKEQDQLARALARPVGQGLAELYWAPTATWADLQDLLLDGQWHVLHFIGHGDFDPVRDEGVLALTREDGREGPGGRAPAGRPAAPGPADAPPGGAELLLRRRGRDQ